jgi:3-oxoacyl-[acyl-carrier-protein] synthase II
VSPLTVPMLMPNGPAAHVGIDLKARAGVHSPASACASGAEGIANGVEMIRSGRADVVVAGGAEACIHPITLAGFAQARTVSTRNDDPGAASRPFDASRDGFVLGEGSGVVILERADQAKARGARIYATIAGHGITSDAYHITGNHPEGIGQIAAMRAAMKMAGVTAADVGHVNAHATSTVVGDIGEAAAIRKAVGDHAVVTAPKGALGHLVGGAGAVEGIITILSLYHGIVPATMNLTDLDPRVQLDVVAGEPRKVELTAAISNSFGFGGHNTALLFTPAA